MNATTDNAPPTSLSDLNTKNAERRRCLGQAREMLARIFQVQGLSDSQRLLQAKQINLALRKLEYQLGESRLGSWPTMLELPVAGKCNLRCTMCGLSHGNPQYPNWSLEEVARFEPFFRYAISVNPTGAGEPLTNKDFFKILRLFKSYATRVGFYTNATILTPEKTEELIDLSVEQVNISIDGATKETFERVRKYAKFETVVGNVRHLIRRRDERNAQLPKVQIAMVLMRDTMHELPDLIRLAADLGGSSVYTMFVSNILPDQMPELEPVRTNQILREARRVAAELKIALLAPSDLPESNCELGQVFEKPVVPAKSSCMCSHPWSQYVVWNDGGVSPCCRIAGNVDGHSFGNINDSKPEELWNSPGMMHLRKRLSAGDPPKECQVCPLRTLSL